MFLIIGWDVMASGQEAVADMDLTSSVLIALVNLLFGEKQALVAKSLAWPFL